MIYDQRRPFSPIGTFRPTFMMITLSRTMANARSIMFVIACVLYCIDILRRMHLSLRLWMIGIIRVDNAREGRHVRRTPG